MQAMSTKTLKDTNSLAFMLFVGAGSVIGGILSRLMFPPQCPVPEKTEDKPLNDNQSPSEEVTINEEITTQE